MRSLLAFSLLTAALAAQQPEPATVSVSVFSLFHPQSLTLTSARAAQVTCDGNALIILPAGSPLTLRRVSGHLTLQLSGNPARSAVQLSLSPGSFTLSVPGKLTRTYTGGLTVTSAHAELQAVVSLPTEAAVASIVAAESPAGAAPEALKAQAIVARSFLLATPSRHREFTACDTTHCQYLRAAPPPASPAARATAATAGMVLTWREDATSQPRLIAAMYSRSCGGSTRAQAPAVPGAYPFFAVPCRYCRRHPELWTRPRPQAPPASERERLAFNRSHGWAAIPSNSFTQTGTRLEGRGTGHGLGLCQLGAQDLARRGQTFSAILAHYFPAAGVTQLP